MPTRQVLEHAKRFTLDMGRHRRRMRALSLCTGNEIADSRSPAASNHDESTGMHGFAAKMSNSTI